MQRWAISGDEEGVGGGSEVRRLLQGLAEDGDGSGGEGGSRLGSERLHLGGWGLLLGYLE